MSWRVTLSRSMIVLTATTAIRCLFYHFVFLKSLLFKLRLLFLEFFFDTLQYLVVFQINFETITLMHCLLIIMQISSSITLNAKSQHYVSFARVCLCCFLVIAVSPIFPSLLWRVLHRLGLLSTFIYLVSFLLSFG